MRGYLIELDLAGRVAIVVGLGRVGGRRARGLVVAGARVVGIDPEGHVIDGVEVRAEAYRAGHLDDLGERPALVLAAATAGVNRRVVDDARERGLLVNSASEPDVDDFSLPAVWRSGALTVGVSTGGASPALAKAVRDRVAEAIGPDPGALAELLATLRPLVFGRVDDPEERRRLLEGWGDARWLDRLGDEGLVEVERALLDVIRRAEGRGESGG